MRATRNEHIFNTIYHCQPSKRKKIHHYNRNKKKKPYENIDSDSKIE